MEPGGRSWSPARDSLSRPSPPKTGGCGRRQHAQTLLRSAFGISAKGEGSGASILTQAPSCTGLIGVQLWPAGAEATLPREEDSEFQERDAALRPGFPGSASWLPCLLREQ